MRRLKLLSAVLAVFAAVLMLSSCDLDTTLNIDKNFSGSREMVCTVLNSELNSDYVFGTADEIEAELRKYLPSSLTMERKASVYGGYRFIFNLKFSDYGDYCKKVEALLGRAPSITYSKKRGFSVRELSLKRILPLPTFYSGLFRQ